MTDSPDGTERPAAEPPGRRRAAARRTGRSALGKGGRGRRRLRKQRTVAKVIAASLLALAMATAVAVVMVYNNWNGNLDHQDLGAQLKNRPDEEVAGPTKPIDILVMGSDSREGDNNIDGLTGDGERSDTTILLHLSADRERAYGISIPRDTLVDRPTCYEEDGETEIPGAEDAMWNEAFSLGGPACTIQQFEQISGIRVENYLVIDFQGFKDMVNALDGVEVCIPEKIEDPEHGITLDAGTREIRDEEALSYVRVRHVGDGTDPQRIRRQQAFMAAMIHKAVSTDMLARPDRLVGFINALTDSIQTDYENPAELANVGRSFQGIGLDHIKFVTTPWAYSTAQEGRVEWTPEVEKLWRLVRKDKALSDEFTDQSISAGDDLDGSESATRGGGDGESGSDTGSEDTGSEDTASEDTGSEDTGSEESSESESGDEDGQDSQGGQDGQGDQGLSDEARESAGLCA